MFCSYCGKMMDDSYKFCPHCGAKVEFVDNQLNAELEIAVDDFMDTYNDDEVSVEPQQQVMPQQEVEQPNGYQFTQYGSCPVPITTKPKKKFPSFGLTGMILGIISGFLDGYIALILFGTLGVIFSAISIKRNKTGQYRLKGFAIAGLVLSIISLAYALLLISSDVLVYFVYGV